jgi:hypothetical protein
LGKYFHFFWHNVYLDHRHKNKRRLIYDPYHLPCLVLLVLLVVPTKIQFKVHQVTIGGTDQGMQVDKASRLTRQAGQQGRQAHKAGRPTRQASQLGSQACLLYFVPAICVCSSKRISHWQRFINMSNFRAQFCNKLVHFRV